MLVTRWRPTTQEHLGGQEPEPEPEPEAEAKPEAKPEAKSEPVVVMMKMKMKMKCRPGTIVRSAEEVRDLVRQAGGVEAADGDARNAALDMMPSEAGFHCEAGVTTMYSHGDDDDAAADDDDGDGDVARRVVSDDVDWSRVHTHIPSRQVKNSLSVDE